MTDQTTTVYTLVGARGVKPIHHATPIPTTLTDTPQTELPHGSIVYILKGGGVEDLEYTYTLVICDGNLKKKTHDRKSTAPSTHYIYI